MAFNFGVHPRFPIECQKDKPEHVLKPKVCFKCSHQNPISNKICASCSTTLDIKTIMKLEQREKCYSDILDIIMSDEIVQNRIKHRIEDQPLSQDPLSL